VQRVRDGYSVLSTKFGRVSAFGFPLLAIMGAGRCVEVLGLRIFLAKGSGKNVKLKVQNLQLLAAS